MFDGKAFGMEVVAAVKDHLERNVTPLVARIEALERRLDEALTAKDVIAVSDCENPDIPPLLVRMDEHGNEIAALAEQVKAIDVAAAVAEAIAALPPAEKGENGKSVTVEDLRPMVEEAVSAAVAAMPKAKDGEPGKDGIGLADALIDRDGNLVLTMTDGRHKNMGRVIGDCGEPGKDGAPGLDGVSMSHFDTEMKDERTIVFKFVRDDSIVEMHEFSFPVLIDRGVWTDRPYEKGDCVTWGGSLWICQRETSAKPDSPDSGWRLAVKKGRDGKDKA